MQNNEKNVFITQNIKNKKYKRCKIKYDINIYIGYSNNMNIIGKNMKKCGTHLIINLYEVSPNLLEIITNGKPILEQIIRPMNIQNRPLSGCRF